MAKFDRVTTGTSRVVGSLESLLKAPGIKLDGKNKENQDLIQITSTDKAKGNIVKIDYLP